MAAIRKMTCSLDELGAAPTTKSNISRVCDSLYARYALTLATIALALIPIKLTLAYIALIPLIILHCARGPSSIFKPWSKIYGPLALFIGAACTSGLFGFDPIRSIKALASLAFFALSLPAFSSLLRTESGYKLVAGLIFGQSIASLHSVVQGAFPAQIPKMPIGSVTESGQLAMVLLLAAGFAIALAKHGANLPWKRLSVDRSSNYTEAIIGLFSTILLATSAFSEALHFSIPVKASLLSISILTVASCSFFSFSCKCSFATRCRILLITIILPLFVAALLVNLKRGPWLGVAVGGAVLLSLLYRRLVVPMLLCAALVSVSIPPIRARLADSSRDFLIRGGRSSLWDIALDLAPRYPLGIGYHNSAFLHKFSTQIPHELSHFHDNALNILVETGWLGVFAFLWWAILTIRTGLGAREGPKYNILAPAATAAFIAWQTAGIVEYNFGDSEVVIIAYLICAIIVNSAASNVAGNVHKEQNA